MRVLVVNNLRSGHGDTRRYEFVGELSRRGAEVTVRPVDDTHPVAAALEDARDFDTVAVIGGDGTISTVAYELRESGVPIFLYPTGTANAVALNLGIVPDPVRCAEAVFDGRIARMDLGEIVYEHEHRPPGRLERRRTQRAVQSETSGFVAIAGVGFDAHMMERGAELKPQFGQSSYLLAALQNVSPQIARIQLDLDGTVVDTEGSGVLFVNFGRMQFDITVTHDSDAQDGMLEIVVIKAKHIAELLPAILASYLDKIVTYPSRSQALDTYRARSVTLTCTPPMPVQSDGEVLSGSTPLTCRVLPRAASFVVPAKVSVPGVRLERKGAVKA